MKDVLWSNCLTRSCLVHAGCFLKQWHIINPTCFAWHKGLNFCTFQFLAFLTLLEYSRRKLQRENCNTFLYQLPEYHRVLLFIRLVPNSEKAYPLFRLFSLPDFQVTSIMQAGIVYYHSNILWRRSTKRERRFCFNIYCINFLVHRPSSLPNLLWSCITGTFL